MSGILDGLRVLDLSWGIAGPMATMLLADHGAEVTRIEPPGGDPFRSQPGYTVWGRGKRSAILDLRDEGGRDRLLGLVERADVLIESFAPGTTERLGVDEPSVRRRNPALVYCSITGYGRRGPLAARQGYDALVAARAGIQWEQRGHYGTTMSHIRGKALAESAWQVPPLVEQTAHEEGPAFLAIPYPSVCAAILAVLGVSAALVEREASGRGQWVETSLLQGIFLAYSSCWQRVPDPLQPGYRLGYFDRRHPKGFFQCADGLWMHQWAPFEHEFIRAAAEAGGDPHLPDRTRADGRRTSGDQPADYEEALEHEVREYEITAAAVRKLPRAAWVELFAQTRRAAQPVLSPEEALLQPEWLEEGIVTEIDDPLQGKTRQVGVVYGFSEHPVRISRPAPLAGEHTELVLGSVAAGSSEGKRAAPASGAATTGQRRRGVGPLEGIRVLDFGIAVAGPFGPQLLSDLGADVIKVSSPTENFYGNAPFSCQRGKRCIAIDLKAEAGLALAYRLVEGADVVHHNMRYAAAERLKIDYRSLEAVNPRIVYCHTRAFEAKGARAELPGNDQMGNALAGTAFELGAVHHDRPPVWHNTAFGDLGNGALSAIAVAQALYDRERTGRGQFVDTSILNGALFYNSSTFAHVGGGSTERSRVDGALRGLGALCGLYETASGWICIVAPDDERFCALCAAIGLPELVSDPRFSTPAARRANDEALRGRLQESFLGEGAEHWLDALDRHGVPAEISSRTFVQEMFDDPALVEQGWVVSYPHRQVGLLEQPGHMVTFSETPSRIFGPPPLIGEHTREILRELGCSEREIEALLEAGVVSSADG